MALFMLVACYRVRDEEIPRIALLTAAFFVASLIHIRVGPTSVHLLLNGLVGVILGRRAGLAIPVGLALQAALLGHGGFSSLGVNACVMTFPALMAGGLFGVFRRLADAQHPWIRSTLVFGTALVWMLCVVFCTSVLMSSRGTGLDQLDPWPALAAVFRPASLAISGGLALAAAWVERRHGREPDFAVGMALGAFAVLATVTLNAAALVWGGAEDWHRIALIVFVAHLPIAVLEAVVVGFTVSFLAAVKPEMLGDVRTAVAPSTAICASPSRAVKLPVALLLATLAGLAIPASAQAHRLEAEYRVLADGRVQVESWFDLTGDSPQGASVKVYRVSGPLVAEGELDPKGLFSFRADRTEPLRVVVSAGAGHRKELLIPKDDRARAAPPGSEPESVPGAPADETPFADRSPRVSARDVIAGIGFLLGLAAFVMSLRNSRALREMRQGS
jgi:cobalt/nickel transport system permease protein